MIESRSLRMLGLIASALVFSAACDASHEDTPSDAAILSHVDGGDGCDASRNTCGEERDGAGDEAGPPPLGIDASGPDANGSIADGGDGAATICMAVTTRYCNDGNDCTLDTCDLDAGCLHLPLPNGSACDDHNACTANDTCAAGVCVGQGTSGDAQVLSELDTFGGYEESDAVLNGPQGLVAALSEGVMVFAEFTDPGMSLKLVGMRSGALVLLDRVSNYASLKWTSAGLWSGHLGTHLVALSSTRIAVVTSSFDIEIYDVVGDKLVFRAYRYLSDDNVLDFITGAAGHDGRLWLVTSSLAAYDIAADGTITALATVTSSVGTDAFAVSEDNTTLYVGGQRGIERIDVTDPHNPHAGTSVLAEATERRPYQIEAHGGYLVIQDEALYNSPGDLRVVRAADFQEVATFPASSLLAPSFNASTGAVFVDGGFLLQRIRYGANSGPTSLVAELYGLDDGGATLRDQWVYRDLASMGNTLPWQPYAPVASGRLAVVGPTQRVVWAEGGHLTELEGPRQGTSVRVVRAGVGRAWSFGSESSHAIEVTDAGLAVVTGGGPLHPGAASLMRTYVPPSSFDEPGILNVDDLSRITNQWKTGGGRFTQFGDDGGAAPGVVGSFSIPAGVAQTSSGGLLYRINVAPGGAWSLDTFEVPGTPLAGVVPAAIESASLVGSVAATSSNVQIAADAVGGVLIVAIQGTGDGGIETATLDWFTRESGAWSLVGTLQMPSRDLSDASLVVRGDVAILVSPNPGRPPSRVDRIGRHGGLITLDTTLSATSVERAVGALGFDGDRVYVASAEADAQIHVERTVVEALSLDTLQPVATYPVSEVPRSMTVVEGHLMFGARTVLVTAAPQCP